MKDTPTGQSEDSAAGIRENAFARQRSMHGALPVETAFGATAVAVQADRKAIVPATNDGPSNTTRSATPRARPVLTKAKTAIEQNCNTFRHCYSTFRTPGTTRWRSRHPEYHVG